MSRARKLGIREKWEKGMSRRKASKLKAHIWEGDASGLGFGAGQM